jgi:hypothetical protein
MFETLFGSEIPLAARFFIAFLILTVPIILVSIYFRVGIRRLIIRTSEVLALLSLVAVTGGAGVLGLLIGYAQSNIWGTSHESGLLIGFVLGATTGFIISAVIMAIFFTLIDIAENTRKTVSFFERVSSRP